MYQVIQTIIVAEFEKKSKAEQLAYDLQGQAMNPDVNFRVKKVK